MPFSKYHVQYILHDVNKTKLKNNVTSSENSFGKQDPSKGSICCPQKEHTNLEQISKDHYQTDNNHLIFMHAA